MGKELKEKYERVCAIKDRAISLVESQLNGNIEEVDASELGEVMDIAKDAAELIKYMEESCYYNEITTAMKESSKEDKEHYMEKYLPETQMYYTPIGSYARMRDSRGRYMYTDYRMAPEINNNFDESYRDRMYYSSMNNNSDSNGSNNTNGSNRMNYTANIRDPREGRSWITRRTYMEMQEKGVDKSTKTKELEKFMSDLGEDMAEMIENMEQGDKNLIKQKLATLASRIS